jgi:hypothetical protein
MVTSNIQYSFYLILFASVNCSGDKKGNQGSRLINKDSVISSKNSSDTTANKFEAEDCMFNDDYQGLTTEWLQESKIDKFIWREDLKRALLPKGEDTVFFGKGGCSHFGQSVSLKIRNDNHLISDSVFWIKKALQLSIDFKMPYYEKMIIQKRITKGQTWERSSWYLIMDDNMEDNLIYNGIEISVDGNSKSVTFPNITINISKQSITINE